MAGPSENFVFGTLILFMAVDFFVADPAYHWIMVTETTPGTWTDGVDTWRGEPGCKSAGELGKGNPACESTAQPPLAPAEVFLK